MRFLFLSLAFLSLDFHLVAQNWQQISDFPGEARDDGAQFTINGIHYVGTGRGTDFSCKGDFYAFDPLSGNWMAIASLPLWQEHEDREVAGSCSRCHDSKELASLLWLCKAGFEKT